MIRRILRETPVRVLVADFVVLVATVAALGAVTLVAGALVAPVP